MFLDAQLKRRVFLGGTLLSSIGTMTFSVGLMGLPLSRRCGLCFFAKGTIKMSNLISICLACVMLLPVFARAQGKAYGGEMLRIPLSSHPELDLHMMETVSAMMVHSQVHRGLFRYTSQGELVADLAESWKWEEGGKRITIQLKEATFSDGGKLTSSHVVNSFARIVFKGAAIGADLSLIEGFEEFSKTKDLKKFGVSAPRSSTVVFRLRKPHSIFTKLLGAVDCRILPLKSFDQPYKLTAGTPTSGAYFLKAESAKTLTLKKWRPDSLDSRKPPEEVVFGIENTDPILLAKASLTDSLDRHAVDLENEKELLQLGWSKWPTELTSERMLILNPSKMDLPVRALISQSIDTEKLAAVLGVKSFRPAYGLIPKEIGGSLSRTDFSMTKPDLKTHRTEKPIEVVLEDSEIDRKIFGHLQSSLKKVGVVLAPVILKREDWFASLQAKKFTALLGRKSVDYFDGYSILTYFRSGFEANVFFVDDAGVDQQLDDVVTEFDEAKRFKRYQDIQKLILNKSTVVPLVFGSENSGLWSGKVKNVPDHPGGIHNLPFQSIEMR
jgi:ABC-type transport system substrate-binding protein